MLIRHTFRRVWLALVCAAFPVAGRAQLSATAGSLDGTSIQVRFSAPLNPTLATNLANYQLVSPAGSLNSVELLADQTTISLTVSPAISAGFGIRILAMEDVAGNRVTNQSVTGGVLGLSAVDIGTVGVDPVEPSIATSCAWRAVNDTAGGSGIGGAADHFGFVYLRLSGNFDLYVEISSLTPVDRSSQAGLMVREDLSPGSRFYALLVNPPPVPAADGTGTCADQIQALYRGTASGLASEWNGGAHSDGVPYPNAGLWLTRDGSTLIAGAGTNRAYLQRFSTVQLPADFPLKVYLGLCVSSHNNVVGQPAQAAFTNFIADVPGDFWPPRLNFSRSGTDLQISWEGQPGSYVLESALALTPPILWTTLTNSPVLRSNSYFFTVRVTDQETAFYRVRLE